MRLLNIIPAVVEAHAGMGIGILSAFLAACTVFLITRLVRAILPPRVRPTGRPRSDRIDREQKPESENRTATVIYDRDGNEVLQLGQSTRDYAADEDGGERTETTTGYMELADGLVWGPPFIMKDGQRGTLVACAECRRQSRRFLRRGNPQAVWTQISSARRCWSCGNFACGKCYTLSSDNHIRCRRCNRRHWWVHHFLKPIFFEQVKK